MQTAGPSRRGVAVAATFALAVVAVIIFFWRAFGGPIPLAPEGYRVTGLFAAAPNLYPNADVRISGVDVGKVVDVSHVGTRTRVEIQMDPEYSPIPRDTRAILRTKTLIGETYVELTPGSSSAPKIGEGGEIPTRDIANAQQLDRLLSTFDDRTRRDTRRFVANLAAATRGRGADLNAALGNLPIATASLRRVVALLDRQRTWVHSLVHDSADVLQTLGSREGALQTLVTSGNQVLESTAAGNKDLSRTVRALPPFLHSLRRTFAGFRDVSAIAKPLRTLRRLAPGLRTSLLETARLAPDLEGLFRDLPAVFDAARRGLPAATRTLRAAGPYVEALFPAGRELEPVFKLLGAYRLDIGAAAAKLAAATEARTLGPDGVKRHYLRVVIPLLNEGIMGYSQRPGSNRHNPYLEPGAMADFLGKGLRAYDCDNASNPTPVPPAGPPGSGPPAGCRVQGPWKFGGKSRYFPHLKRAGRGG